MYFEDHSGTALNWSEWENFIFVLGVRSEGESDVKVVSCSSMSWPKGSMLMSLSLMELRGDELPVNLRISLYRDSVKKASVGVRGVMQTSEAICRIKHYDETYRDY